PAVADVLAKAGHPLSHPLSSRWSSVVKQWKTPPISFLFMPLRESFLRSDGGYTYTPSPSLESILLPLCARRDVDSAPRGQQLIGESSEKDRMDKFDEYRALGMGRPIARRDFLNGVAVGIT